MPHVKRLVMKGFKSFARETVITMDENMNVIVGPNGSGKSNITDALCFVLGRLSIKSIRAAKSSHLIFSGNKHYKPASVGFVEIVWDNSDGVFSLSDKEIAIRRTVKKNGQSIYKINGVVKTRTEVVELLSQAGIDPHGFNIVLQGEIQKFVKMHGDERRRVIEEVAGIGIYEMRKEKSLREMEKTQEKLRQVGAILRERTNYLKNLENEREQALRYKKLEVTVKRCKGSIINRGIVDRRGQLKNIIGRIEERSGKVIRIEKEIVKLKGEVDGLNSRVDEISKTIQKSSGVEQDSLVGEISVLKQEFAGMLARKENYENQLSELNRRKVALEDSIELNDREIKEMVKEKGKNKKEELVEKMARLEKFEDSKRKYFLLKSQVSSLGGQVEDKKKQITSAKTEAGYLLEQIEGAENEIRIKGSFEEHKKAVVVARGVVEEDRGAIADCEEKLLDNERELAVLNGRIKDSEKIKGDVGKLDVCPLCQTKITKEHIGHVVGKSDKDIEDSKSRIDNLEEDILDIRREIKNLKDEIVNRDREIAAREIALVKLGVIRDKKDQLNRNNEMVKEYSRDLEVLEKKKKEIEERVSGSKLSEEGFERLRLEVSELQRSEERNLGVEITAKQRELDRMKLAIKQIVRDREEISEELGEINDGMASREDEIEKKEEKAEELKNKYQKMYEEKNRIQDKVRGFESGLLRLGNEKRVVENEVNNINIEKAQISAKVDTLKEELSDFNGVDFINIPVDKLREKLGNAEIVLARIGNVNLRALEVYDEIKEEYDKIREKVEQLEKEKESILKIIVGIDKKKKKVFVETLNEINEVFSRNFSQLNEKGIVSIESMDKKDIFNSGLSIIVKVGAGKYFDITSLSGGEQTLVALSLIFAIQELNPYCFYIFDEIDAALDRRNSEKLAYLLRKHMKKGQYIIITHNDSIISESSNVLYGVSMQEGISKVLSLEI